MRTNNGWLCASNPSGNCVEVTRIGENVHMRDSQDRDGPVVAFTPHLWREFIGKIKQSIPVFEKVNAFETPKGPKGDFTVLFVPITPWTETKLYYTEPELDAFWSAVQSGKFDYDVLPSSGAYVAAEVP